LTTNYFSRNDAQWILNNADPNSIYTEAELELVAAVMQKVATGDESLLPNAEDEKGSDK
jgi:hypothetical protein